MDEYISREETINAIKSLESSMPAKDNYAKGYDAALGRVLIAVREVPPVTDVQPVVHAYWIELPKALNPNENPCKCSNCGHILSFMNGYPKSKYCDECGAKMDIIYEDDKVRAIKVTGWDNYCGKRYTKMDGAENGQV